eukprot:6204948-Pleurochrysis_carterae.AAC.2
MKTSEYGWIQQRFRTSNGPSAESARPVRRRRSCWASLAFPSPASARSTSTARSRASHTSGTCRAASDA